MKAVQVSRAGGAFEVVERDMPAPGEGEIRVKVEACGICHSDALVKYGFPGLSHPRIPGHEIAGAVSIAGWPSGGAIDSAEALAFSVLTGVRPRIETFRLDQAEEAFERVMDNKVRFRAVLVL